MSEAVSINTNKIQQWIVNKSDVENIRNEISCVLSLTNPVPELYYAILYGFTSAAILVIFIGLYFIFE